MSDTTANPNAHLAEAVADVIESDLVRQGGFQYKFAGPRVRESPGIWSPATYSRYVSFDEDDMGVNVASVAAAVVAAINPTIATAEELGALPVGTVIRDSDGALFEYSPDGEGDIAWWYDGDPHPLSDVDLPATVLYRPDRGGEV